MNDFFDKQDSLTAAKITIYKEYISGYLPKILQTFKRCQIADLFCGAGKNGDQDGSPLVLIDRAEYILSSEIVKRNSPKIEILFNDREKTNTDNLKLHLNHFSHPSISILGIDNGEFQTALKDFLQLASPKASKFFFLDPFKYSDVNIEHLRILMGLPNSEVLLFIPVFHSYRFASKKDYPKEHKTRKFVEEFTTKGMFNYSGIDEFMQSIKEKFKKELHLDYVRPILLDDGNRKNAVFLLTKHREGMLLMNEVAFKQSDDGKGVNIKVQQSGQRDLFGTHATTRFDDFTNKLEQKLEENKSMTNDKIVDFCIQEEFLPKHAKDALNIICSRAIITVKSGEEIITDKPGKWNIAKKINKVIVFNYGD
jgi:three-Cys-motif partner protein